MWQLPISLTPTLFLCTKRMASNSTGFSPLSLSVACSSATTLKTWVYIYVACPTHLATSWPYQRIPSDHFPSVGFVAELSANRPWSRSLAFPLLRLTSASHHREITPYGGLWGRVIVRNACAPSVEECWVDCASRKLLFPCLVFAHYIPRVVCIFSLTFFFIGLRILVKFHNRQHNIHSYCLVRQCHMFSPWARHRESEPCRSQLTLCTNGYYLNRTHLALVGWEYDINWMIILRMQKWQVSGVSGKQTNDS